MRRTRTIATVVALILIGLLGPTAAASAQPNHGLPGPTAAASAPPDDDTDYDDGRHWHEGDDGEWDDQASPTGLDWAN